MSELPSGWAQCSLEDCVEILDSLRVPINNSERQQRIEGKTADQLYPYYGATGQVGFIDSFLFDEELVALGEDGVPFFEPMKSKAYMLHGKTWVNNHAHVLRGLNGVATNKFVLHYLNQFDYQGFVNGGTRLKLTQANMRAIPVTLPPLAEQTRIAQKLDELLAQVDTLKARIDGIPALLKRFRQSVLAAAVSGRLTEEWRQKNSASTSADQLLKDISSNRRLAWKEEQLQKMAEKDKPASNEKWKDRYQEPASGYFDPLDLALPKNLPSTWVVTNLDSVTKVVTGKTPPTADPTNWEGHIPFISPSQIHKLGNILDPARYVTAEGAKLVPVLPIGTTLIVCIGTIGKVGLLDRVGIVNQQINALIPYQGINAQFLNIWAKTLHLWLVATASATVNAAILNKGRLAEAPFPLPSELEQTEIVRRVEHLFAFADQLEAKVASAKSRIDHLTQSILAKAFRGELVPQDPNDEPASVLLQRIKAQRAAAPKAKRGRKASA